MKKIVISVIVLVLVVVFAIVLLQQPASQNEQGTPVPGGTAGTESAVTDDRMPAEISVGIYDPANTPSAATELLESRLKKIGFDASVMQSAPDLSQVNAPLLTVLFKSGEATAVDIVKRYAAATGVVRKFEYSGDGPDVIIIAWSLDDIRWSDLQSEADTLMSADPASVGVTVYNAGAASGEAGRIADVLKGAGYTLATGENGVTESIGDSIIYYQRNYRTTAKQLVKVLRENGYPNATYRARQDQAQPIIVELMGTQATEEANE